MEELLLKDLAEFGFPALISLYLLTKALIFAETISKLTESVSKLEKRLDLMELHLKGYYQ